MKQFEQFYESAQVARKHIYPELLKFLKENETAVKTGNTNASIKVLRVLSNISKVPTQVLLKLQMAYSKGDEVDNTIQFDPGDYDAMVAEATSLSTGPAGEEERKKLRQAKKTGRSYWDLVGNDESATMKGKEEEQEKKLAREREKQGGAKGSGSSKGEEPSEDFDSTNDPFSNQPLPLVDIDTNSIEYIIGKAIENRLTGPGNEIPITHVTHSQLVEKLQAQEEIAHRVQRKPVLLYGQSGVGKTVGITEYAKLAAVKNNREFAVVPLHALVSSRFEKDEDNIAVYPDPVNLVDNSPVSGPQPASIKKSLNSILDNVEGYFILLLARPAEMNPLIFARIPDSEEAVWEADSKQLNDEIKTGSTKKVSAATKLKSTGGTYLGEPGGGDFGNLIKATGKFKDSMGLMFLDELTRVEDELFFNLIMPYTEPDNLYDSSKWSVIAAGNAGDGFTGVRTIEDTAQKDRYGSILTLKYDPEQWLEYAKGQGLDPLLSKFIESDMNPFGEGESQYSTQYDDKYKGKTYAIPLDQDPDAMPSAVTDISTLQAITPRRLMHISAHLRNIREQAREYRDNPDLGDVDNFIQRQLTNLGTEINVPEYADAFLQLAAEELTNQKPTLDVTDISQGEVLAEYIYKNLNNIPDDIAHVKVKFVNAFHKKSDLVLAYGDEDNPFAAFNTEIEGSDDAARIKGIKDIVARNREANINFTTSIIKRCKSLFDALIGPQTDPVVRNLNTFAIGSHGAGDISVSLDNTVIGILYKIAWMFNMLSPDRLGGQGLKFTGITNEILDEFCVFMTQKVFNDHLQRWLEMLVTINDTPAKTASIDDELDNLEIAGKMISISSRDVSIDVDVDVPLKGFNPELLPLKLLLTLCRYIAPYACPQEVPRIDNAEQIVTDAMQDDLQTRIEGHHQQGSGEEMDYWYQVDQGGRMGDCWFDNIMRPGDKEAIRPDVTRS